MNIFIQKKIFYLTLSSLFFIKSNFIFCMKDNKEKLLEKNKQALIQYQQEKAQSSKETNDLMTIKARYELLLFQSFSQVNALIDRESSMHLQQYELANQSMLRPIPPYPCEPLTQNKDSQSNACTSWCCPSCKKTSIGSRATLSRHIDKFHRKNNFTLKCPFKNCTKIGPTIPSIMYHLRDVHEQFKICCQKLFFTEEQFDIHKLTCGQNEPQQRKYKNS